MPKKIHILSSAVIHAIVVVTIFLSPKLGSSSDPNTFQVVLETELVEPQSSTISNNSSTLAKEETDSQDQENNAPIEYAGAPTQASEQIKQPEPQESSPDGVSLTSDTIEQQHKQTATIEKPLEPDLLLPAADILQTDGMHAPAFTAAGLSIQKMENIVRTGQGLFVVICGNDVFKVVGSLSNPSNLCLVQTQDLARFSQRALSVPLSSCSQIMSKLQWEFGVTESTAANTKVRLLLTNTLDQIILSRQRQAVTSLGLDIKDVVRTAGKFRFSEGRIIDFEILSLQCGNGKILAAESEGIKNIIGSLISKTKGSEHVQQ